MSGWEMFTWITVLILGVGAVLVFMVFLMGLPDLLKQQDVEHHHDKILNNNDPATSTLDKK